MQEAEEWRQVVGFPNYEVSNLGRVRSYSRNKKRDKPKILSPNPSVQGYHRAYLKNESFAGMRMIHTLVLEAFVCPRPEGMEACHGVGGQQDNRVSNLCWGTREKNNGEDKIRDGKTSRGTKNPKNKLSEEQVIRVKKLLASGMSQDKVAVEMGIGQTQVSRIYRGEHWGWLKIQEG